MSQVASTDLLLDGEQRFESGVLLVGEEAHAGVLGAAGLVERVASPTAMAPRLLLNALPAPVETIAGEADHVERDHHGNGGGELFRGGGLEPGEPVHRDDLDPVPPRPRPPGEPLLEHRPWNGP